MRDRYNALSVDYSPNAKLCGYQIPFRMAKMLTHENVVPKNFLDCGSGTGLLGAAVRKNWPLAHITGIDFAGDMLAQSICDGNADDTVLYNLMDADWPVAAHGFDLVGAAGVLNYAPNPHDFIAHMAAATSTGGHIILSFLSGQENQAATTDDGSLVYLWSRQEIENSFIAAGIEARASRDVRSYSGKGIGRVDTVMVGVRG